MTAMTIRDTSMKKILLVDDDAELRQLLIEAGIEDGLDTGPRTTRRNAFADMLDEEYPETQA